MVATPRTSRFYRAPGLNHCSGGPTTDQFCMLTPLVKWVEKGQAVDSRPLCAYPKVARYKGSGDIEKAENFVCQ
jgi:feruloyl esterase